MKELDPKRVASAVSFQMSYVVDGADEDENVCVDLPVVSNGAH